MFRPLRLFNKNTVNVVAVNTNRTKIVFSESFLDKAERIKLWNLENKLLFGSIIELSKVKSSKTLKAKSKKVSKTKGFKQHTEVVVPFSLFALQKDFKTEAIKKTERLILDSKLTELISSQRQITKDIHLQIDNVFIDMPIKKSSVNSKIDNALHCSGLPLEIDVTNTKHGLLTKSKNCVPSILQRNLKLFPMLSNNQRTLEHNNSDETSFDKILRIASTEESRVLPSVTKVLDQTMSPESKEQLEKWKTEKVAELGQEGFEKYMKNQLDTGSRYHDTLSKYLVVPPPDLLTIDPNLKGLLSSVSHVLKSIKSPRAIESHVVHPVLKYQGVIDCIAFYQNKPTLIEWKTSNRPKPSLSMTYDNPIQLAAYFGAISHDPNYKGLNVRDALLVIAYTDGSPADIHHLKIEQLRAHWASWLTRLEKYWANNEPKTPEPQNTNADNVATNKDDKNNSSKG